MIVDNLRCNSNQKWNNDKCECKCKKYYTCKKNINWNPSMCICDNSKYLKSIVDDWVIECDEVINFTDSVSTNVTNTISKNVTVTVPINSDDKKVRYKMDYYIFHTFLIVVIYITINITNNITIHHRYYLLSLRKI